MKVDFYAKTGEKNDQISLPKEIFGIVPNEPLLTQYIHVYRTNQRQGTSKVKTRSEVRGGGRKPWRQKGTGRARHGSIRSPIWRGGGITHGPIPKSWKLSFPRKMRVLALKSALSLKREEGSLKVVESLAIRKPSTRKMQELLEKMEAHGRVLFVQKGDNKVVRKSLSNLHKVEVKMAENLSAYDVLLADVLVLTEDALKFLESKYADK